MTAKNIITETNSIRAAKVRASKQNYASRVARRNVTLTPKEEALLVKKAKKAGRNPTVFLKELALLSLHQQDKFIVPADLEKRLGQLILETRKLGTNINQIAKLGNRFKSTQESDLESVRQMIFHLEGAVKKFVRNPSVEK